MAKLTVRNVGPIREAEVEVKKHTVFIGPQGTGKSTLAKLIAICGDYELLPYPGYKPELLPSKYNIDSYFDDSTYAHYSTPSYEVNYKKRFDLNLTELTQNILDSEIREYKLHDPTDEYLLTFSALKNYLSSSIYEDRVKRTGSMGNTGSVNLNFYGSFFRNHIFKELSSYIPAERTLTAILSNAIWGLVYSDISLPKNIVSFAKDFERVRNQVAAFHIPFLDVTYEYSQGEDIVIHETGRLGLSQSASGYQSIIPLLMVVEQQRIQSGRRFIIEEPELNLYPIAQKDLVYNLIGGLLPNADYYDTQWVITTHSPYVLSSFNTLMLAYKVAQRSDELKVEVEKIIPSRCWINPDDFAAYYVDNGTVRSIINEKTGLIADNELDDVSEDLAGEQDQLIELSRSVPRA